MCGDRGLIFQMKRLRFLLNFYQSMSKFALIAFGLITIVSDLLPDGDCCDRCSVAICKSPPDRVQFIYSEKGKPALANQRLQFNVAHSQSLALYAVTLDYSIGVDLEAIRAIADLTALTQRFFSPNEHAAIAALPANQQSQAFFRYWTCKEAYLKATGHGLAKLQELEISLEFNQPCLRKIPQGNIEDWHLRELTLESNFVGAVAVSNQHCNFIQWQL